MTGVTNLYFDSTTVDNDEELFEDTSFTTPLTAELDGTTYQVTLNRYSDSVKEIDGTYYYPLKAKADGEDLQDVGLEDGGLLYEALTSSTASEVYSIKDNVATDTGVSISGIEPSPADTDSDSDSDTDNDTDTDTDSDSDTDTDTDTDVTP